MHVHSRRVMTATVVGALVAAVGTVTAGVALTANAATAGCQVSYAVPSQWPGGFTANVNVTNLGNPLTSWTLTWSELASNRRRWT